MIKPTDIFKKRKYCCPQDHRFTDLRWESDPAPICPECGAEAEEYYFLPNQAPGVIGDEIDVEIRHGLCHPDGTPRRFRSMKELRQAASEKGWVIAGETPNLTSKQKEERAQEQERWNKKWR